MNRIRFNHGNQPPLGIGCSSFVTIWGALVYLAFAGAITATVQVRMEK